MSPYQGSVAQDAITALGRISWADDNAGSVECELCPHQPDRTAAVRSRRLGRASPYLDRLRAEADADPHFSIVECAEGGAWRYLKVSLMVDLTLSAPRHRRADRHGVRHVRALGRPGT